MNYVPVFEVWRGDVLESLHYGAAAVVDSAGRLLASVGDPKSITFLRSSAKPFQAIPLVESGAAAGFGLSPQELAIICASHDGTDEHVSVVAGIQSRLGLSESDLLCGVHPPLDPATAQRMRAAGQPFTPNRHNCSGKHTGMLLLAKYLGLPLTEYLNPEGPVQQRILEALSKMCGLEPRAVALGTDGCSAPTFAVSLQAAALAYARLADPGDLIAARASACRSVVQAMTAFPKLVGGEARFDSLLMSAAGGRLLAKGGAEGYQGMALLPGAQGAGGRGIGICLKIADGDHADRARSAVALELLRKLALVGDSTLAELERFGPRPQSNWRGLPVGMLQAKFDLDRAAGSP
jgi:L-asparaginase II